MNKWKTEEKKRIEGSLICVILYTYIKKKLLRSKRKEARESRQRHCKVAGKEDARELSQEEARESHHIFPGMLESVRE